LLGPLPLLFYTVNLEEKYPSSDTQGWFRLLHQPLGQSARKALNLPPKIDTKRYSVRSNQKTALLIVRIVFIGHLAHPKNEDETNEMIVFIQRYIEENSTNRPMGWCSERNHRGWEVSNVDWNIVWYIQLCKGFRDGGSSGKT